MARTLCPPTGLCGREVATRPHQEGPLSRIHVAQLLFKAYLHDVHDLIEKYTQRIQLLKIYEPFLLGRGQISSEITYFNLINSKNNSTFICPVPGSLDNNG